MKNKITILFLLIGFISGAQAMLSDPEALTLQQLESRLKEIHQEAQSTSNNATPNTRLKARADCQLDKINFYLNHEIPILKKQLLELQKSEQK